MNIAEQIKQVEGLRGAALREKFRDVTGLNSRSNNRPYLVKRIIHALQARAQEAPETAAAPTATAPAEASALSRTRRAAPKRKESALGPKRERDPRLPPAGTMIQKRARDGSVRCECKVEADGIRYKSTLFKSLSAAAMAAAKDLGIGGRSQNGYTFFGLSKPPRRAGDALEALGRAWERYRERAAAVVGVVTDENREQVRDAMEKHGEAIKDLRRKAG
jgi:hypothetical protein